MTEGEAFATAFEDVAREVEALAADDVTGGGMVRCHLRDAAGEIRRCDTEAARMSLDGAIVEIERMLDKLDVLDRGEVPA